MLALKKLWKPLIRFRNESPVTNKTHLNALTDKAVKQLRFVNLRDVPRFQITGQMTNFQDYPSYSSLDHFFSSFETVMHASGNDVELVWKQYIPMAMHYSYHTWMDNDLLQCSDWKSAKALFVKHYGVPVNSMELISRLFNVRMKATDTLQDYTNRFVKNVQEAGFNLGSNTTEEKPADDGESDAGEEGRQLSLDNKRNLRVRTPSLFRR